MYTHLEYEIDVEGATDAIDETVLVLLGRGAPEARSRVSLLREVLQVPADEGSMAHHPTGAGVGLYEGVALKG
jgi:hypothetical protein